MKESCLRFVFVHDCFRPRFFSSTNLTDFRASECRAELVRAMPSAAENIELVKIRATYKVAIIYTLYYSCIFVKFVGYKKQRWFFNSL